MKSTVLITGGSGLLAINWALAIRDRYSVMLGLHERDVSLAGVRSQRIDLESVSSLVDLFKAVQPRVVIHTSGLTSVEGCEANANLARKINATLAFNVAQACAQFGSRMVHISTDHLFPGNVALVEETCPVAPINFYGKTKAEAETLVLNAYPQALVIRTNFYGWGPYYRQSFSDLIINTLRAGKCITLFDDVFYTPIVMKVLIEAIHELVSNNASGIFHLVGDERISKYHFGLKVSEVFHLDASLIKLGFIADQSALVQRPHDMSLSNHKACNFLGRRLGGVSEHLEILRRQEQVGFAYEIQQIGA